MLRARTIGSVVLAVALLAAACGGDDAAVGDPQVEAETPSTTQAPAEEPSEAGDPAEPDVAEPVEEDAAGSDPEGPEDAAPTEGFEAAPADAEALLAAASTSLDRRSLRGEVTLELVPGFALSAAIESDAEGDMAATTELPPGMDPEFPGGAEVETRYVGGMVYVRPPVPAGTLAELGLDEAWYVDESAVADDAMAQAMGSAGGMCIVPLATGEAVGDCDPLGETGVFLEAARGAEIVGRENVHGAEATRVRFLVSLMDLAGEAVGMAPDDDDAETGAFDDTASDPFAEGIEQIFGFLDAEFEVEVWIDDESLIRRLSFDLASLFAGIAGPEAAVEMPSSLFTLEFYDFDADISVEAPPPESIVDVDLLVGDDDYATSEEFEPSYEGCEEIYDEEYDETIVVCE